MIDQINTSLQTLYKEEFNEYPKSITPLTQGGSDRRYFRLTNSNNSVIGAFNPDVDENRAFFYLTNHFEDKGIQVPHILRIAADEKVYLLDDLGDASLFDTVIKTDWESSTSENAIQLLKRTLENLAKVQVQGAQDLDFSRCYPKSDFDLQSILWDFNYFKYCFLKPSGVAFNEVSLDNDFLAFA
ncbi:MAG TPA: phosphotransferase, partial [Tenuifilaceae bacterium]|nr:phosphotransferase [Tenuifilaceae bacterium]